MASGHLPGISISTPPPQKNPPKVTCAKCPVVDGMHEVLTEVCGVVGIDTRFWSYRIRDPLMNTVFARAHIRRACEFPHISLCF